MWTNGGLVSTNGPENTLSEVMKQQIISYTVLIEIFVCKLL